MHFFSKNQLLFIDTQLNNLSEEGQLAGNQALRSQVQAAVEARMKRGAGFKKAVSGVITDLKLPDAPPARSIFQSKTFRFLSIGLVFLLALLFYFFAFSPEKPASAAEHKSAMKQERIENAQHLLDIQFHYGATYQVVPAYNKKPCRKVYGTP